MSKTLPQHFSLSETIKIAWHQVKGVKGTFFASSVLLWVIAIVWNIAAALIPLKSPHSTGMLILFGIISAIALILIAQTIMGQIYLGILRAKGETINIKMIGHTFHLKLFFKVIGVCLLKMLIIFPITLLHVLLMALNNYLTLNSPHFNLILTGVISVAIFILTIYVTFRMCIASSFVIANNEGPVNAIKKSVVATKSHVLKLFLLYIFNVLMTILSVLFFGIGIIWSIPYLFINNGVVFKILSEKQLQ